MTTAEEPVVLITGGAGFLGRALVHELTKRGALLRPREVRVLDRPAEPPAELGGVTYLRGDVRSLADLERASRGAELVYHLAAVIDWGQHPRELVRSVNVEGTRNMVEAAVAAGARALVATSSLDAIYPGRPIRDADESVPYPPRFASEYCSSKADSERIVLAADRTPLGGDLGGELRTIVLRPCSIWGEGDPYHITEFLKLARLGPVARLGRNPAPSQHVYVRNVAHALVLAGRSLLRGDERAAGEVFFVTDFPAKSFFDHMEPFVRAAGGRMVPPSLALPRLPVKLASYAVELGCRLLRPVVRLTPAITPFSVEYVCGEFTVRTDKAARVLGYEPIYGEREAYERTTAYVENLARTR